MNRKLLPHALWALAVLVAFLSGRVESDRPAGIRSPLQARGAGSAVEHGADAERPREAGRTGVEAAVLGSTEARAKTFELLSTPNRIERLALLCELLKGMTSENCFDISSAFGLQTIHTGRTHHQEWRIMLERLGEVGGAGAVEKLIADGNRGPMLSTVFSGWAAADSKAAGEWFDRQAADVQRSLAGEFFSGMARADPGAALGRVASEFLEDQTRIVPGMVDRLIQDHGIDYLDDMLPAMRARTDLPDVVKGQFQWNLARRRVEMARTSGQPLSALEWLDSTGLSRHGGPGALQEVVQFTARRDAAATFAWALERGEHWDEAQANRVFPIVAEAYQSQAPDAFLAWARETPDHPWRDSLAFMAAQRILDHGRTKEMEGWLEVLRDSPFRAGIEQRLQQLGQRQDAQAEAVR